MAKLTKKQEKQFETLLKLYHELIKSKHSNNRSDYEAIISEIREEVKNDSEE